MTERLGASGIDKRIRRGLEPETMLAGSLEDQLRQEPPGKRSICERFLFGSHMDGSLQQATLIGLGEHKMHSLFPETRNAWDRIMAGTLRLDRLTVFVEGRVRYPDINLSDEEIFNEYEEPGLLEAFARRAGVTDIRDPEPDAGVLVELAEEYGYDAVNDYLYERLYRQWSQLSEEKRPNFSVYAIDTVPKKYYDAVLLKYPFMDTPGGFGVLGSLRRLRDRFPGLPQEGAIPVSDELVKITLDDTTHVPILQGVPEERRNRIQKVAVAYNYERDVAYINAVIDTVADGRDVAFIAGSPHIRAMMPALQNLHDEFMRERSQHA